MKAKYYIKYDHPGNAVDYYYGIEYQSDTVYFETEKQTQAFIDMYEKEIKKIMEVK